MTDISKLRELLETKTCAHCGSEFNRDGRYPDISTGLRAALAVAEPIVRRDSFMEAAAHFDAEAQREGNDDTAYTMRTVAAELRKLSDWA